MGKNPREAVRTTDTISTKESRKYAMPKKKKKAKKKGGKK
jgi:hypothetical protein